MSKKGRRTQDSDTPLLVTWQEETFRISDKVGVMPLLTFAKLAEGGADSHEMAALAAMYDLLEQCIDRRDWEKFKAHATKVRADHEDLLELVGKTMEVLSGRPTERPSDSSDGPPPTRESSTGDSSLQVINRELEKGRPDLALAVYQAHQAQKTA